MKRGFINPPNYRNRVTFLLAALISCACLSSISQILEHWNTNLVSTKVAMENVIYANGRYVAFGSYSDYGVIFTSEDGKNWTLRSDGFSSGLSYSIGFCYTGGKFFALGGFGTSGISSNGIDWDVFSFPNYGSANGVAYGAGVYVAVSDACDCDFGNFGQGRCMAISPDGKNWIAATNGIPNSTGFTDIAYGAGKFVAVGPTVYASGNGTNWSQRFFSLPSPISFQNGLFFVPNGPGTNLISPNGLGWFSVQTGVTNVMWKVVFSHGIFLARAGSYLITSTDGSNWVHYPNPLPGNSFRSDRQPDIATDGARLVTVGFTYDLPNYNGFIYDSEELVGIRMLSGSPRTIALSGLVGRTCEIDYVDQLPMAGGASWLALTNFQVSADPTLVVDGTATNLQQHFYRGVLLP